MRKSLPKYLRPYFDLKSTYGPLCINERICACASSNSSFSRRICCIKERLSNNFSTLCKALIVALRAYVTLVLMPAKKVNMYRLKIDMAVTNFSSLTHF